MQTISVLSRQYGMYGTLSLRRPQEAPESMTQRTLWAQTGMPCEVLLSEPGQHGA
jgi:hypothetical protein